MEGRYLLSSLRRNELHHRSIKSLRTFDVDRVPTFQVPNLDMRMRCGNPSPRRLELLLPEAVDQQGRHTQFAQPLSNRQSRGRLRQKQGDAIDIRRVGIPAQKFPNLRWKSPGVARVIGQATYCGVTFAPNVAYLHLVAALVRWLPGLPQGAIGIGKDLSKNPIGKRQRVTQRHSRSEALPANIPFAELQLPADSFDGVHQALGRGGGPVPWR